MFITALVGALGTVLAVSQATVEEVSSGYVWAENLVCDQGTASVWVSDAVKGTLSAVSYNEDQSAYETRVHLSGLSKINGLALDATGEVLYGGANVVEADGSIRYTIIEIDRHVSESYKIVSDVALDGTSCANGLAADWTTGLLYTTTEGGFKPGAGEIFEVDPVAGTSRSYASGLFAADGAYINQDLRLLYVSQVVNSKVLVFNLSTPVTDGQASPILTIEITDMGMLDDFFLTAEGTALIGADFLKGNVIKIPLYPDGLTTGGETETVTATVLAEGFTSPTSARQGCGMPGFEGESFFVTEGGGFADKMDSRRVLKVTV